MIGTISGILRKVSILFAFRVSNFSSGRLLLLLRYCCRTLAGGCRAGVATGWNVEHIGSNGGSIKGGSSMATTVRFLGTDWLLLLANRTPSGTCICCRSSGSPTYWPSMIIRLSICISWSSCSLQIVVCSEVTATGAAATAAAADALRGFGRTASAGIVSGLVVDSRT